MPSKSLSFLILVGVAHMAIGQPPVKPPAPDEQALFEELPVVEAASLHVQSLEEAPADVTIISAADIRKYGYRTLAEALAGVRGFDVTYEHVYHNVGVHGFSLPADFNTRFLVMLNGHALTENIFDSNRYFGQDFGLDMDLVQRIEVIRGPSSALYGSNGMFATINVVTVSPVDQPRFQFSTESGGFGEKKAMLSSSTYLGHGANLLISASVFHNRGQDFYFPEFDSPQTLNGVVRNLDSERGYHTFANLIWRDWDFEAYFNSREKQPPLGWLLPYVFAAPGDLVGDKRDFVRVSHSNDIGPNGKIRWQVSYDRFRYDDRFDAYTPFGILPASNLVRGEWLRPQIDYSFSVPKLGRLTVGAQAQWNWRSQERNQEAVTDTDQLNLNQLQLGVFIQQEISLSARWKANAGLRYDRYDSTVTNGSLSPRLALNFQQSPKTVFKFVYGHPFRNPSPFEQYADSLVNPPLAGLRPETAHTFEFSVNRKFRKGLSATVNLYDYQTRGLIQALYIAPDFQYRNTDNVSSKGAEFELSGKPWGRLDAVASMAFQHAINNSTGARLINSPGQLGKLRVASPMLHDKLTVAVGAQYLGARKPSFSAWLDPVFLADATITTNRLFDQFDLQFGIRNLLNRAYYDPVALIVDRMRGDGRSAYVKLILRSKE